MVKTAIFNVRYFCIGLLITLLFSCFHAQAEVHSDTPKIETEEELNLAIERLQKANEGLLLELQEQQKEIAYLQEQKVAVTAKIDKVKNILEMLDDQVKYLSSSTKLSDSVRQELLNLPEKPKQRTIDAEIADYKAQQINYNNELNKIDLFYEAIIDTTFSSSQLYQYRRLVKDYKENLEKINSGYSQIILGLSEMKEINNTLTSYINEINEASHQYFFWVPNVNAIGLDFPTYVIQDLKMILGIHQDDLPDNAQTLDVIGQLTHAIEGMFNSPALLFLMFLSLVFVAAHFKLKKQYYHYLEKAAGKVGKVTQDSFSLTLRVIIYSLVMAMPFPIMWAILGYGLQMDTNYPIANAFGMGVNSSAPILWFFMITAKFSEHNGLFIAHLRWKEYPVKLAMRYYKLSVWILVPLIVIVNSFDQYNNQQFAGTIGRICFILLCLVLVFLTNTIHRTGVPLYLDKKGSADNIFSHALWAILLIAPWIAIAAACLGYLSTSEVLLGRLEASVGVWFTLLTINYLIRRWMLIQRRRIEFDRAKQRRLERLAQRSKSEEEQNMANNASSDMIEEPVVDLDTISAQSLHLVRSIILMVALIFMILLWSELHSAFAFMNNITLWRTTAVINGNEVEQYITLSSLFIAVLIITITIQLVKNFPALLELGVLQHLDLAPGTGYAITSITKYSISMIGAIIAFSFLGIDWSKIQWLLAALGVGLGFGLQEIFANFISGIIMLFEKPIRIGDTVTIRDLTGTITKIQTRATTIVDWDRKEIVMPNKAFVTEQLINWSLSDGVTRIVLSIPATIDADADLVQSILLKVANECESILDEPTPEVFLVDIQEGIQIFELRIFTSDINHRMPVRDLIHKMIIAEYRKHKLTLPFPPIQANLDALGLKSGRRIFRSGSV